jgi:hypothetical protein
VKIYISATYSDLQKHRLAVLANLRRMGHQPLGMEDYAAEGVRPLSRCLADVAKCDAYVGIIAWRYGYVPTDAGEPDAQLPEATTLGTTSITEFEFRQAVQSDKPVLMFLLDPEAEWPSTQIDAVSGEGERGKEVSRLRQEIGQQYLVSFFRTPEELASLVGAAVYREEMSRQMSLESLQLELRLNQPFVRNGPVTDSTLGEISDVIAGPQEVQALQINLGQGRDWWMTRLYFLSSLAADLTSIEAIVFVDESETFIGMSNPRVVKERLAQVYPMLQQYEEALAQESSPTSANLSDEVNLRSGIWMRLMGAAGGEDNVTVFVTKRELERWLSPYFITQAIDWEPDDNAALRMQRLVDWPMRFVPVVEKSKFARVVDKNALTEQVARLFVREQVSRALSTMR